jgi:hypothetical protein
VKLVVETANVNAAVNVDVPANDAQQAAERLRLPLVGLTDIDHVGAARWTVHPSALPAASGPELPMSAGAGAALWLAVSAGDVTAEHESGLSWDDAFFRRIVQPDQIASAVLREDTLLDRTAVAFSEHWEQAGSGKLPAIVWVTKPNGLLDCLWFWNLRALRSFTVGGGPMLLLPDGRVQHWLGFGRQFREILVRPDEFSPDVLMASLSLDRSQLEAIASELGLVPTTSEPRTGHRWSAPPRSAPFTRTPRPKTSIHDSGSWPSENTASLRRSKATSSQGWRPCGSPRPSPGAELVGEHS